MWLELNEARAELTSARASKIQGKNMHLYAFIHALSFGRHTQKNTHKNNIFLYAYMQVLAGTH